MARVAVRCPNTTEPIGLPLTANSLEELAIMSFAGIELAECPRCGEPHDFDEDECFLLDDEGGTPVFAG